MEQYEDCQPKDLSMKCNKRLKPIPPPLNLGDNASALKEFAILATSPKSPLMQKNLPFRKRAHSLSGTSDFRTVPVIVKNPPCTNVISVISENSYAVQESVFAPESPSLVSSEVIKSPKHNSQGLSFTPISVIKEEVNGSQISESSNLIQLQNPTTYCSLWSPTSGLAITPTISSVLMSPVGSSREELNTSTNVHPWPVPVWGCFQPGTYVKMDMPSSDNAPGVFRLAEEHGPSDWIGALKVENMEKDRSALQVCVQFCCLTTGVYITARCSSLHTFFVREKGWCAVFPDKVAMHYQVACQTLELGDICYPPQSSSPDVCERFKRFSFPPEEVTVPTPFILSPPSSPCKKPSDSERPKRPMNAFMLFAKRYRLELIQMHPGKDNRAISVILGEAWRNLPPSDKEEYVLEARAMAQEQKRLHPDCWKRKRSHSTS